MNLAGRHVNLSELPEHVRNQTQIPVCPIPEGVIGVGGTEGGEWIPITPLEEMEQTDYDVLVVGTGAGGGAVLWRLIEQLKGSGKRIGIVDRGGLLLQTHVWNIATMNDRFVAYFFQNSRNPLTQLSYSSSLCLGRENLILGGRESPYAR